jgi:NAD(P)-dependent dehydrogenase (short-subunit alcohol dehydrogenase family)
MKTKKFTRRDIIKVSGLSLAALSVPSVLTRAAGTSQNPENDERVAFITGGARGIGLRVAEHFAKDGINVVIYDIADQIDSVKYPLSTTEELEKARQLVESAGVKCLAIKGDVRNLSDLKKAVNKTIDTFGRLDFLIANAAVTQMGEAESFENDIIEDMMAINVGGVLKTIQAAIPVFKKQNSGRIVTMSSVAGRGGAYMFSLYSATKWGVIGLAKTIAQELGRYNVTCNAVCPTMVKTHMVMNSHMLNGFNPDNPTIEGISEFFRGEHTLPVGALDPNEIANTVLYLCSDQATFISGSVIDVSAGYTARNNA